MPVEKRQILATAALPYSNGPLHIGHIFENIQVDIWVRFQRMRGHTCTFISAEDGHGTATMLKAEELGITPEDLVARMRAEHLQEFKQFYIQHDNYHITHSVENRRLSEDIYRSCKVAGSIFTKEVKRPYDEKKAMFLADRFICGTCPKCGAVDQHGDSCEVCSATYDATEMINPVSTITGTVPVQRVSEHLFFDLPRYIDFLKEWIRSDVLHESVANKLDEWLQVGLIPWDISRDEPYFGFRIPDTKDKFFYVWVDAPVGYMASFMHYTQRHPELDFDSYWDATKSALAGTEVHHFIGKDIIYFHSLFWPAMLKCAGYRTPTRIHTHGFLTIDNVKMSKSKGLTIGVKNYCAYLQPECLRYYFAARSSLGIDDINMDLNDFMVRVNSDIVGKLVNIASRCAGFITRNFDGVLAIELDDQELWQTAVDRAEVIAEYMEKVDFSRAVREIMQLADKANQYIDKKKPWVVAKRNPSDEDVRLICTQGINQFRLLMIYLKPVLPKMAKDVEAFLNVEPFNLDDLQVPLLNTRINKFVPLMRRIEKSDIQKLLNAGKLDDTQAKEKVTANNQQANKDKNGLIGMDTFIRTDLRVALIESAEIVPEADKLLKLKVNIGSKTLQIFAGIRSAYAPEDLEGKLTIVVANLQPRKMRFGVSHGMVLAASDDAEPGIFLLHPDKGAKPGMRVS